MTIYLCCLQWIEEAARRKETRTAYAILMEKHFMKYSFTMPRCREVILNGK
jgi:hypothetical protein